MRQPSQRSSGFIDPLRPPHERYWGMLTRLVDARSGGRENIPARVEGHLADRWDGRWRRLDRRRALLCHGGMRGASPGRDSAAELLVDRLDLASTSVRPATSSAMRRIGSAARGSRLSSQSVDLGAY